LITATSSCATTPSSLSIPNEPCLDASKFSVDEFLHNELSCDVLDELYPYLHLIATKSSSHIAPLHDQIVKGRSILITERPGLHLVWYYKQIFIKPIPHCLLNASFWKQYLCPTSGVQVQGRTVYGLSNLSPSCRAALGFLRSYSHLIQHESDFHIAKSSHLTPFNITYTSFQIFIAPFRHISDEAVTPRYHYGQIRLTRLNWAVRLFRPSSGPSHSLSKNIRWFPYYQNRGTQTGEYFEKFGAPLLFLFASLTLILSSMQVVLAARPEGSQGSSRPFQTVSWGFSVTVIIFIVGLSLCGGVFLVALFSRQLVFGVRLGRKRTGEGEKNEGV
jgi:hypothetical protein